MEAALMVLVFTSLLREGTPFSMKLFTSTSNLTWDEAKLYCTEQTGSLLVLDSKEKWNVFIENDGYQTLGLYEGEYWIDLKLNDTVQCNTTIYWSPWLYDGWARWQYEQAEPNNCPVERCVGLQDNWMLTSRCDLSKNAICEKATSPAEAADVHNDVLFIPSDQLDTDISSNNVANPSPVEAADVHNDVLFIPSDQLDTDMSFTDVANPSTPDAADVHNDVLSIPSAQLDANVEPVVATTYPTEGPGVKHDLSPTTLNQPNQPDKDDSSTVPNMAATISLSNWKGQTVDITTSSTTSTPVPSAIDNDTCSKCCPKSTKTRKLDQHDRDEIKHALKIQLALNKSNLSIQRRKVISVYDSRPSCVAIGGTACVILVVIVGVIVVPDVITLGGFLCKWS